jgi:hypothetical protein
MTHVFREPRIFGADAMLDMQRLDAPMSSLTIRVSAMAAQDPPPRALSDGSLDPTTVTVRPLGFSLSAKRVPVRLDSYSAQRLRRYQGLTRVSVFVLAPLVILVGLVGIVVLITTSGPAHTGLGGLPVLLVLLLVVTMGASLRARPAQYPSLDRNGWVVYRHVNNDCVQEWALRWPGEVTVVDG